MPCKFSARGTIHIDGDFDMIFDPAIENPGTAFNSDVLHACLEIEKNLFDMAHGLSNHSKIISHIMMH